MDIHVNGTWIKMGKNTLEGFSDGVLAIIITIMVLELNAPHGDTVAVLMPLVPALLTYVLSFVYLGIYWNNHHHMLHACNTVGSVLWANLHLLFWLSLIPFTTSWMRENPFATLPAAAYGAVLLMAAIAYRMLQRRIIASQGEDSILKKAIGSDWKGKLSALLYVAAIGLAFVLPRLAVSIYVLAAIMWVIPDRRIERVLTGKDR